MKGSRILALVLAVTCISLCTAEMNFLEEAVPMMGSDYALPVISQDDYEDFKAFILASGEEPEPTPDPTPSPTPAPTPAPSTWDNLVNAFSKLTNGWGKIVDAFKTKRSSEIKERLLGKGFDYFNQSAQIQVTKGIKDEFLDKYLAHIEARIKVPDERQKDLKMVLEEARWAEKNAWNAFNTLFALKDGGNVKFCSILIARNDEKNTYDFLFTDITAAFKFAPDVLVVSKKLSVLGGLWEDSKDEQISVPRSITQEDVQTVLAFFHIVAFKGFADQLGIKIDFPQF